MSLAKPTEPADCVNALRAMIAYAERQGKPGAEPVTYQAQPIMGFSLIFRAGSSLALLGHGMEFDTVVYSIAMMLNRQRAAMSPAEFRRTAAPLVAELATEVVDALADLATKP